MKTWNFQDKTQWPERGPWDSEPDKAQWIDEATGLDCLMLRAHSHWCGYVGVPEDHPLHGKSYDEAYELADIDVHGGLTFSDRCDPRGPEGPHICHVPEPGRPDNVWWLGFDCMHSGDFAPSRDTRMPLGIGSREYGATYKDFECVRAEVTRLARQIAKAAS